MADPVAAVVDTHPLVYHAGGGSRLGAAARRHFQEAEAGAAVLYVPAVVIWELGLLTRTGRVQLRRGLRAFVGDLFSNPAFRPVPLTVEQVVEADGLGFTRDPFDALIVAAARELDLPLVTRDQSIEDSGVVETIW